MAFLSILVRTYKQNHTIPPPEFPGAATRKKGKERNFLAKLQGKEIPFPFLVANRAKKFFPFLVKKGKEISFLSFFLSFFLFWIPDNKINYSWVFFCFLLSKLKKQLYFYFFVIFIKKIHFSWLYMHFVSCISHSNTQHRSAGNEQTTAIFKVIIWCAFWVPRLDLKKCTLLFTLVQNEQRSAFFKVVLVCFLSPKVWP